MTKPPIDPRFREFAPGRNRVDHEITFDEVRRALLGHLLREDHSTVLKDPLTERMAELLKALETTGASLPGEQVTRLDRF